MAENTAEKVVSFEQSLEQLQNVVRQLEGGALSLEDSLKAFEQGVRMTRDCQKLLSDAEQKIELLSQSGMQAGRVETQSFKS